MPAFEASNSGRISISGVAGNHNLLAGKPRVAGLDDQVTNRPTLVVHHKTSNMTNRFFAGLKVIASDGVRAPQMRIVS